MEDISEAILLEDSFVEYFGGVEEKENMGFVFTGLDLFGGEDTVFFDADVTGGLSGVEPPILDSAEDNTPIDLEEENVTGTDLVAETTKVDVEVFLLG